MYSAVVLFAHITKYYVLQCGESGGIVRSQIQTKVVIHWLFSSEKNIKDHHFENLLN